MLLPHASEPGTMPPAIRQHGEYRTRRLVLAAWDRMEADGTFGQLGLD